MFCRAVFIKVFKIQNGSVGAILFPLGKKVELVASISVISSFFNNLVP